MNLYKVTVEDTSRLVGTYEIVADCPQTIRDMPLWSEHGLTSVFLKVQKVGQVQFVSDLEHKHKLYQYNGQYIPVDPNGFVKMFWTMHNATDNAIDFFNRFIRRYTA